MRSQTEEKLLERIIESGITVEVSTIASANAEVSIVTSLPSGDQNIGNVDVNISTISTSLPVTIVAGTLPRISFIEEVSAIESINLLSQVVSVGNVDYLSQVGSIGNVDYVSVVQSVAHLSVVQSVGNVDFLSQVASIGNIDHLSAIVSINHLSSIASINYLSQIVSIGNVNLVSQVASIGNVDLVSQVASIGNVDYVSQILSVGHLSTIGSVTLEAGDNNIGNVDVNLSSLESTLTYSQMVASIASTTVLLSVNGATTIVVGYLQYANLTTSELDLACRFGEAGSDRFRARLAGDGGMINMNLVGGYWEGILGSQMYVNITAAGSIAITIGYNLK